MLLSRPVVHAILGQQLRVDIPVQLDAGEQLATRCVQVQADAGSDPLRADQLQIRVQHEGSGLERIQVRSHHAHGRAFRGAHAQARRTTRHWPQSSFRPARACAAGLHPG
ncbi:hypothetical protein THIX_70235 [Thiomonas sp. X19]|nr:hypothetical protein THIX_70235 [Thiomonas sp. X19]